MVTMTEHGRAHVFVLGQPPFNLSPSSGLEIGKGARPAQHTHTHTTANKAPQQPAAERGGEGRAQKIAVLKYPQGRSEIRRSKDPVTMKSPEEPPKGADFGIQLNTI